MISEIARYLSIIIPFSISSLLLPAQTIFTSGSSWRYLDNGTDPGLSWNKEGFTNTAWKTGNSKLGYGKSDEATVVSFGPDAANKYITTYFLKEINIPDINTYKGFRLNIKRDDGVVLYINGVEVGRDNMPTGPVTYRTLATGAAADNGENLIPFDLGITSFKSGVNLIAAEIHQNSVTSTDIAFDAELVATNLNPQVSWFWSGALTSTSIKVNVKTESAANVRVAFSKTADLANPSYSASVVANTANNFTTSHAATGLTPNTKYFYGFEINGAMSLRTGTFKTIQENIAYSFKFALGSCSEAGSSHIVFDSIRANKPDFFLATGDFFYADIADNDINLYRDHYRRTLSSNTQSALYREIPIGYMWDDHDYGPKNSNSLSRSKPAALASYKENVPHYPLVTDGAIYQSFTVGRVRFILTDLRSQKVPSTGNMMGATQLTWFKNELLKAKQEGKMIAWVSSIPYISTGGGDADDNWAAFPSERTEIANFLQANGIKDIFILSGDAHMLAIDNGTNSDFSSNKQGPRIPVFHAAALDRRGGFKGGPYSLGAFQGSGQYGIVEVADRGGDNICIKFRGRSTAQRNDVVTYSFCSNTITSIGEQIREGSSIKVNQTRETLDIDYAMQSTGPLALELVDLKGIIVYTRKLIVEKGPFHHEINLANVGSGIYHLLLKSEKESISQKIYLR